MSCDIRFHVAGGGDQQAFGVTTCRTHGYEFPERTFVIDGLMCPIGLNQELLDIKRRLDRLENAAA